MLTDTEAALQETRHQLEEVNSLLQLDPDNPDLRGMVNDLTELLSLQERSLLEEKRAALLDLYGGDQDDKPALLSDSIVDTLSKPPVEEPPVEEPTADEYPPGSKCCIPFPHTRNPTSRPRYYLLPALVLSHTADFAEPTTSVLLLTPPTSSTRPCDAFLDGNCPGLQCRHGRSHGHSVQTALLLPYEALEIEHMDNYSAGSRVWCQYGGDEVWYLARVVEVVSGGQEWRVRFLGYGEDEEVVVGHEGVVPVKCVDGDDENLSEGEEWSESEGSSLGSSEESESEETDEDAAERTGMAVLHEPLHRKVQAGDAGGAVVLGQWEAHTRGVASRMMERMGYKMGQGLGLTSTGRLEPIEVELHPQGRSLDFLDESRSGGGKHHHRHHHRKTDAGATDPATEHRRQRRKRKRDALDVPSSADAQPDTVFAFLNASLSLSKKPLSKPSIPVKSSRDKSSKTATPAATTKELHVTLARLSNEIVATQQELERAQQSLARNKGGDLEARFREKVEEWERRLNGLKRKEAETKGRVKGVKEREKMMVF